MCRRDSFLHLIRVVPNIIGHSRYLSEMKVAHICDRIANRPNAQIQPDIGANVSHLTLLPALRRRQRSRNNRWGTCMFIVISNYDNLFITVMTQIYMLKRPSCEEDRVLARPET